MRTRLGLAAGLALALAAAPALGQPKGKPAKAAADNPYGDDSAKADVKKADAKKADAKKDEPAPDAKQGDEASKKDGTPTAEDQQKTGAEGAEAPAGQAAPSSGKADTRSEGMRAYQKALEKRKLSATAPLSAQRLRDELGPIEEKLANGRRDEAIGDLVYFVEQPRFEPFASGPEGRAMLFLLGDALGRAGAYEPSRGYLQRLLTGDPKDTNYRRAARTLVELGLESGALEVFLKDLEKVPASAPEELRGDIAYLKGRALERRRDRTGALAAYAAVSPKSRFWAQATYLSGVIEVERGQLKKGENLFCKVADPKRTPKKAPLFGGSDFFRVRDLARLGLGRVAHEQYRFDDARYYYYLIPKDSDRLPEALYEASTTRYEAKDYEGARELMNELRVMKVNHAYEDEAWILDAYIDLASCKFFRADAKLQKFLKRYDPVRDAARRISKDDTAVKRLVETVREGSDPAAANLGVDAGVARTLGALMRVDAGYGTASRRLAQLDVQLSGLRGALGDLDEAARKLATPKAVRPQAAGPIGDTIPDKIERIEAQIAEVRRLMREAERSGGGAKTQLEALKKELEALEIRARAGRTAITPAAAAAMKATTDVDLTGVIQKDRERAAVLHEEAQKTRQKVESQQIALAKDALIRLDRRLSRLLRRARLGRIETVLGEKRSLEVEIEALSQGLLPQTIVDSLKAERWLGDDEEYWPFDGEDWEDEYVGGEGLR
jgi:tetratricopeptide (TPR) repeat protein